MLPQEKENCRQREVQMAKKVTPRYTRSRIELPRDIHRNIICKSRLQGLLFFMVAKYMPWVRGNTITLSRTHAIL